MNQGVPSPPRMRSHVFPALGGLDSGPDQVSETRGVDELDGRQLQGNQPHSEMSFSNSLTTSGRTARSHSAGGVKSVCRWPDLERPGDGLAQADSPRQRWAFVLDRGS
jgi:hypothetical protein